MTHAQPAEAFALVVAAGRRWPRQFEDRGATPEAAAPARSCPAVAGWLPAWPRPATRPAGTVPPAGASTLRHRPVFVILVTYKAGCSFPVHVHTAARGAGRRRRPGARRAPGAGPRLGGGSASLRAGSLPTRWEAGGRRASAEGAARLRPKAGPLVPRKQVNHGAIWASGTKGLGIARNDYFGRDSPRWCGQPFKPDLPFSVSQRRATRRLTYSPWGFLCPHPARSCRRPAVSTVS